MALTSPGPSGSAHPPVPFRTRTRCLSGTNKPQVAVGEKPQDSWQPGLHLRAVPWPEVSLSDEQTQHTVKGRALNIGPRAWEQVCQDGAISESEKTQDPPKMRS